MKSLVQRLVILVLVLVAAGAGWAFLKGNGKAPKDLTQYEEGEVSRGDVRSFVTATGVRNRAVMFCFFGPRFQDFAPWISVSFLPPASWIAISAALRPSSRASLKTVTV